MFRHSVGEISYKYPVFITPSSWAFGIWGLNFICIGGVIAYCNENEFSYSEPTVLSNFFFGTESRYLYSFPLNRNHCNLCLQTGHTVAAILRLFNAKFPLEHIVDFPLDVRIHRGGLHRTLVHHLQRMGRVWHRLLQVVMKPIIHRNVKLN